MSEKNGHSCKKKSIQLNVSLYFFSYHSFFFRLLHTLISICLVHQLSYFNASFWESYKVLAVLKFVSL